MSDSRPIGVFDSGLGGLTVVREIFRLMPDESVVYLGDTARVPYGGRSDETIQSFAAEDARFLLSTDIKMLIVGCNTASSVALEHVRTAAQDIPVIGVVLPGSKAAVMQTAEKRIGVIGTRATIHSGAYTKSIHSIDNDTKVFGKACPLFVPIVEEGMADSQIARLAAQQYLYELVDAGIDCLILGCTHYPLLMETIQGTVGTTIQLIDSAFWTAREAQDILLALDARAGTKRNGVESSAFYVTDKTPNFQALAQGFIGMELPSIQTINLDPFKESK